ncbi:hypothetical protein ACET3Z_000860 [Daucus carota]
MSASILKRSRRPSDFDLIKSNSVDGLMVTQDKENITPGQSTKRVRFAEDDPVVNIGRNQNLFKHGTVENVSRLNNVEFLSKKLEADNHFHNISFPNKMLMDKSGNNIEPNVLGTQLEGNVKSRRRYKKDFENWLLVRFQPKVLTDAIKSLSANQRQWVKKTGFSSILSFRMNQYPQALGYNIVKSFQTIPTCLTFGGNNISITDDDVNEVLGLPKGQYGVQFMRSTHIEDMWRDQFKHLGRVGWKITANMVGDAIKKTKEVDRMFKLNFLVLLHNVLIEGPTNPYVRQTMLGFAGDLDNCYNYNWCRLLISQLKIASISWNENPETKYYTGSVPFLVDQTWNTDDQELSDDDEVQGFYDTNNCMIITPAKTNVETDVLNNYPPENIIQAGSSNFGGLVKQHDDSHFKGKNQASQSESQQDASQHIQIPTYVIDKLSENMDIYEDIQKKCMMYLSSAKGLFRKNQMVENLEAKFIKLIQDANQFIMDELTVQYNKDCETSNDGNGEEDSKKIGTSTDITVYTNPLDEDICLSSQE